VPLPRLLVWSGIALLIFGALLVLIPVVTR